MRWLDDKIYTNEFLETLDKEKFPLTYKMCSKNKFDTGSIFVRKLIDQEIDHPIWIAIYEERKPQQFHIYSLEVYKSYQLQNYGRKALTKFKENAILITLCSLPETKVFYEKLGFKESDDSGLRLIWRKKQMKTTIQKATYTGRKTGVLLEVESASYFNDGFNNPNITVEGTAPCRNKHRIL